jgi:hypothetical protein
MRIGFCGGGGRGRGEERSIQREDGQDARERRAVVLMKSWSIEWPDVLRTWQRDVVVKV